MSAGTGKCDRGKKKMYPTVSRNKHTTVHVKYKFQLVEFCGSKPGQQAEVDIIPTSWISFNKYEKRCITKYPPPPYDVESWKRLHNLVRTSSSPPDDWPWWDIRIKGGADSYEEALVRVDKLKTFSYAYTTDCDVAGALKSQEITEKLRQKCRQERLEIKETFDDDWICNADEKSPTTLSDESSAEAESVGASRKKKYIKKGKSARGESRDPWIAFSETIANTDLADGNNNDLLPTTQLITDERDKKSDSENAADFNDQSSDKSEPVKASEKKKSASKKKNPCVSPESGPSLAPSLSFPEAIGEKNNNKGRNRTFSHLSTEKQREVEAPSNDLSSDTLFLLKVLKRLSVDIAANTAAVNALHDAITTKLQVLPQVTSVEQLQTKYRIHLPFETTEEFEIFYRKLEEDPELKEILISSLKTLLDRNNNTTKSITTILRKFFSRTVATGLTAQKKMIHKILLRDTNFGMCVKVALVNFHTLADGTPVNEKFVWKCAGSAISNAKDWDGRKNRNGVGLAD